MTENLLYIVLGDQESDQAVKMLTECGVKFRKIVVGKEGDGKSMWRDLQTTELPTFHSSKGIFVGVKAIGQLCQK